VTVGGNFTMNSSAGNTFNNYDTLIANGQVSLNSLVNNQGFLFSNGADFTVNSSANVINGCYFRAGSNFTYNGSDTLFVTGYTWTTTGNFVLQGLAMSVTGDGLVQGVNFSNNSTKVIGNGDFLFSGNTVNQAPFGNDGNGLNFYDSGIPSGGKFFDTQNTNPGPTVTKNFIPTPDLSFVPNTCSNIIKKTSIAYTLDAASIAAGNSINSVTGVVTLSPTYTGPITVTATASGCGPSTSSSTSINLTPVVGTPVFVSGTTTSTRCQSAGIVSYSAAAPNSLGITYALDAASLAGGNTINTATGDVTYVSGWSGTSVITVTAQGCNSSTSTSTHTATIVPLPNLSLLVLGSTVCSNISNATVTISGTSIGESYQAYLGTTAIGTPVSSLGGLVTLNLPVSSLSTGWNNLSVKVTKSSCATVSLTDTAAVNVNPLPSASLVVSGSTVCSTTTNATVTISGTKAGESYQAYLGA